MFLGRAKTAGLVIGDGWPIQGARRIPGLAAFLFSYGSGSGGE